MNRAAWRAVGGHYRFFVCALTDGQGRDNCPAFAVEGSAVALDASDGTVLWTEPISAPPGGRFSVSNGTLYVGYGSGVLPALGSAEGDLIAYREPGGAKPYGMLGHLAHVNRAPHC